MAFVVSLNSAVAVKPPPLNSKKSLRAAKPRAKSFNSKKNIKKPEEANTKNQR